MRNVRISQGDVTGGRPPVQRFAQARSVDLAELRGQQLPANVEILRGQIAKLGANKA